MTLYFAGAHNITNLNEPSRVVVKIEKNFSYPLEGKDRLWDGDLALLKLAEDLPLDDPTKHLVPICLPEAREPLDAKAGQWFTVSGWGEDQSGK